MKYEASISTLTPPDLTHVFPSFLQSHSIDIKTQIFIYLGLWPLLIILTSIISNNYLYDEKTPLV